MAHVVMSAVVCIIDSAVTDDLSPTSRTIHGMATRGSGIYGSGIGHGSGIRVRVENFSHGSSRVEKNCTCRPLWYFFLRPIIS